MCFPECYILAVVKVTLDHWRPSVRVSFWKVAGSIPFIDQTMTSAFHKSQLVTHKVDGFAITGEVVFGRSFIGQMTTTTTITTTTTKVTATPAVSHAVVSRPLNLRPIN